MIYRWFKKNRQLMRARDAATQSLTNRDRKLSRVMGEIADRVAEAIDAGNNSAHYHLKAADTVVRSALYDRLANEGYIVNATPIGDSEDIFGADLVIEFAPRKGLPR